jgi:hypothetical protein
MLGRRFDEKAQNDYIRQCRAGTLDVAVVSVKSGKNGCNLQGMNWMVSLGYIGQYSEEEQAKGIASLQTMLTPGRCCRVGQQKPTRFYVLWVAGQPQDEAPHDANKLRMTEAEALTRMEPKRLLKKVVKKVDDDDDDDEDYEE